tara:strand:- start:120 stop:419 length:300 start_codon:yes stop_codon:yes gene_type:complete
MRSHAIAVAIVLLGTTACAVNDPVYTHSGKTSDQAAEAYQQCLYQAEIATANAGATAPKYDGKVSDAVSSGVADGIARGYEQGNLVNHCMKMQGYSKSS